MSLDYLKAYWNSLKPLDPFDARSGSSDAGEYEEKVKTKKLQYSLIEYVHS